jgi:hypothetical protein
MKITGKTPANLFAGSAAVSPTSSNTFTQGASEPGIQTGMAFNAGGRDARGPNKTLAWFFAILGLGGHALISNKDKQYAH